MNKPGTVLVTGASGKLGRRVVELLMYEGAEQIIATTRTPAKLADLTRLGVEVRRADADDPLSLWPAFKGAQRMILIGGDSARSVPQNESAIHAAESVGVEHVVFASRWHAATSPLPAARVARATEIALEQSKLSHTILRNNLHAETLTDLLELPRAMARGEIVSLLRDEGVSMVTRDDAARATVAAALQENPKSRTLEIGGPSEVRVHHLAILLGSLAGVPLRYRSVSAESLRKHFVQEGLSSATIDATIAHQLAITAGAYAGDSDDFTSLTGRVPTSLVGFLMFHADDAREWAKGAERWKRVS